MMTVSTRATAGEKEIPKLDVAGSMRGTTCSNPTGFTGQPVAPFVRPVTKS